jgi:hypothetical protein
VNSRYRATIVSALVLLFFFAYLSLQIRPIADDYCAAAQVTSDGYFGYMKKIYETWSGDSLQIFAIATLVGFPLAHLPFAWVGITTLFLFIIIMGIVSTQIKSTFLIEPISDRHRGSTLLFGLVLIISWSGYWSLPSVVNFNNTYQAFLGASESFGAVFGWPIMITAYLIVPGILFILFLKLWPQTSMNVIVVGLLGFAFGISGYALALAMCSSLVLFQFFPSLKRPLGKLLAFQTGLIFGVLFSILSPGAQTRTSEIGGFGSKLEGEIVFRWILVSGAEFVSCIFNLGILLAILVGFTTAIFLVPYLGYSINFFRIQKFLLSGFIFGVTYFVVISFSELFAYAAFWHLVPFKTFLFFYFISFGVYLGIRSTDYASEQKRAQRKYSKYLFFFIIVISLTSMFHESSMIVRRAEIWPIGPAALPGISDIYPEGGWVDSCWQDLRKLRNIEDRIKNIE